MDNACRLCQVAQSRGRIIWESPLFVSCLDIFPVSPGHALVIPRRHVVDLNDLTDAEWVSLRHAIQDVIHIVEGIDLRAFYQHILDNTPTDASEWYCRRAVNHPRINTKPDAYNHGLNDGRAAGRTVDHLHWHIIPRYEGDMEDPRGGVRHVIPEMGNYTGRH